MVAAVEILLVQAIGDAIVGVGGQHQSAQHRLLGFDRLRRHAELFDPAIGARVLAAFAVCVGAVSHRKGMLLRTLHG